jgi:hypothetical protein
MRSQDVIDLFDRVGVGARVEIVPYSLTPPVEVASVPQMAAD